MHGMQVVYDVASAIGGSAFRDIAHRDVTPNNFGHSGGRGFLYDFSASKVLFLCSRKHTWFGMEKP